MASSSEIENSSQSQNQDEVLADDESNAEAGVNEQSQLSKKRPKRSHAWEHFEEIEKKVKNVKKAFWKCKYCSSW